jgi:hypothetical protein
MTFAENMGDPTVRESDYSTVRRMGGSEVRIEEYENVSDLTGIFCTR